MTVNQERMAIPQPVEAQIRRKDCNSWVPFPEDGALARSVVDEDEGGLASGVRDLEPMGLDTFASHFSRLEFAGRIISNFSNVAGTQTPTLAGYYGGRYLATRFSFGGEQLYFRIGGREIRQANDCVGGVDADPDDIHGSYFASLGHFK